MTQVSRPLLIALAAAVVFLGVWMVALKPQSSSSAAPTPVSTPVTTRLPVTPRQPASTVSAKPPAGTITARPVVQRKPTVTVRNSPSQPRATTSPLSRFDTITSAIKANKVVAMLFYNPAAPDDRAVKQELAAVPLKRGRVVALAVPISEVTRYPVVASQVMVASSPTLVVIDRDQHARTIVGFTDGVEISQRVADALAVA